MRILVVDDKEEGRYLLEALLRGSGHEVAAAANGAEALEALRKARFDLVISDVLMPVMDGFELCRRMRGEDSLRQIPFILHSATHTGPEDQSFAAGIGADRFIQKPCEPEVLLQAIREFDKKARPVSFEAEQLQALFDGINEVVYVTDPWTYEVLYVNRHVKDILGKDPIGGLCHKEFQGLESPCDFCTNDTIIRLGGEPYRWEHHNRLLDRHYSITDRIITWPDGRKVRFEVAVDITDRKRAEQALRESEESFRNVLEAAGEGIIIAAKDGTHLYSNRRASEITGYSADELLEIGMKGLAHPDELPKLSERLRKRMAGEEVPSRYETAIVDKKGKVVPVEISGSRVLWRGVTANLVVFRDITQRKQMEEALKEQEERYRTLVEESFDGIFVQKGPTIVFANRRLHEMLGYAKGEMEGMYHWLVYHPDYQDLTRERARARMRGEDVPARYEVKLQRKDGSAFDGEILARRIMFGDDPGIQVWVRDITESKRAEQALRENEEKYRTLVENSLQGVLVIQDFRIVYANRRCEEIAGYTVEELLSLHPEKVVNLIHPDDQALVWGRFGERLEGKEVPAVYRYRGIHKDGSVRWVEMYASLIELRGRPAVQAALMDVTEAVLAQKSLEASEEKYRVVVENALDSILVLQDGIIRFANRRAQQGTGFTIEELLGRPFDDFIHPEDREIVREYYTRRLRGDRDLPKSYFFRVPYKGGEPRWIRTSAVPITWEDRPAVLAFLRDITRARKTEEEKSALQEQFLQAQKMEAIGRLAGGVAHDFNNLLTVIKGTAQLSLCDLKEGDPLKKNIEEIIGAADRAAALTTQLLAFSRRQIMEVQVIDMNQVVQDLDKMLRRIMGEDIELVTLLQDGIGMVKADLAQIGQAIVNIVVNARDAMQKGGRLTIETANVELDEEYARSHAEVQPGPYVMLSISDTGSGMPAHVRERIFEPFFTTKERGKGTGLGLSTAYGIVKQSNGHISVYSEPGQGTTFKVYLPRVDESVEETKRRDFGDVPKGDETIVVVEDEDAVRELAVRMLKKQGYKVLVARDGGEALMLCERYREPIDLILSDVVMPGMSGREVVERLQGIHPEARALYMSGYTDNVIVHHGILDKGTALIHKPFTLEGLARKVREVLDE